jgi:hypothetical protein
MDLIFFVIVLIARWNKITNVPAENWSRALTWLKVGEQYSKATFDASTSQVPPKHTSSKRVKEALFGLAAIHNI